MAVYCTQKLIKAHIPLEMGFTLATQREQYLHTKNEMYMVTARNLRLGPNATYIPLTRVGGFASSNATDTNMLVSFGLGNAKVWPSQRQYPTRMVLHPSGI